uniref:Uncharacterized protein n=1 Tax=Myripristis murdjan TaxID=586833 RepID=A0A667WGG0_9TELE
MLRGCKIFIFTVRVSCHLSGHPLLIESAFWQPVAGNEMFSCKRVAVFIHKTLLIYGRSLSKWLLVSIHSSLAF